MKRYPTRRPGMFLEEEMGLIKRLCLWLSGYRTCYVCSCKKLDVRPLITRCYDEEEFIGFLCFQCFASNQDKFQ